MWDRSGKNWREKTSVHLEIFMKIERKREEVNEERDRRSWRETERDGDRMGMEVREQDDA